MINRADDLREKLFCLCDFSLVFLCSLLCAWSLQGGGGYSIILYKRHVVLAKLSGYLSPPCKNRSSLILRAVRWNLS